MSNQHDSFGNRFEAAVDSAHMRGSRTSAPSPRAWRTIRTGMQHGTMRAETADPRATGPDLAADSPWIQRNREESNMDVAIAPQVSSPSKASFPWMGWAAIAIVGVLLASSLFTTLQQPPNNGNDDLAWAPGMGTPESTPAIANACITEPLTVDETMETVMNPNNGYRRLGVPMAPGSESMWEPEDAYLLNGLPSDPQDQTENESSLFEPADDATSAELEVAGNDLWTCLQEGTAYQVWGILDPILVQQIILNEFPVIRTESDIRAYIEEVGPMPFLDANADRFSTLSNFTSAKSSVVTESYLFEVEPFPGEVQRFARIHFASPESETFEFRLFVREAAPGVWIIYELAPHLN